MFEFFKFSTEFFVNTRICCIYHCNLNGQKNLGITVFNFVLIDNYLNRVFLLFSMEDIGKMLNFRGKMYI